MSASSWWSQKRVLVTGASGFVGRNLVPLLERTDGTVMTPSRREYDLLEQSAVRRLFADTRPDIVFHLAGLVGGIAANQARPADFCQQNLLLGALVVDEAWRSGVEKYITLIGGCSYPATAPSPIAETELWNGYPQAESAPYSLAKATSVLLTQSYRRQHGFNAIVLVPGNLYGPHDNFDLEDAHVIPATIRKLWDAARNGGDEVVAWGTGRSLRDFIYIDDACEAILIGAERYNGPEIINISSGTRTSIRELVDTVAGLVGYRGRIRWDTTRPDGQMDKGFDVTRMRDWLGYECRTPLREGLRKTVEWFEHNYTVARL